MSNNPIDRLSERISRRLASHSSRRSFLSRLGTALVSAPLLPLLPVARANAQGASAPLESESEFALHAQTKDEKLCTYWRYCAMSGDPCSCSGGGLHTCPAGALPSPTAWIGTCLNPDDKKSYLIAYHDCCGKHSAEPGEDCECNATDRALPIYRPQGDPDVTWCFGQPSFTYHCSVAMLVGLAE